MGSLSTGGGSSAVAASAHAGCERFRYTDPLLTGLSRRALAEQAGFPDTTAGIPEARWMRAMTFERLVHSEQFVSELLTKAVGRLGLPRPEAVRRQNCHVNVDETAQALAEAHRQAVDEGVATMLVGLAVPFLDLAGRPGATPVKPDFAIVCPRHEGDGTAGSWLVMGDAKDYERVRSRIDDARLLKGFLQVALGAESAQAWDELPPGMAVHPWGALAVPRNAFLQPEAVVEQLDDHREEVRARARERLDAAAEAGTPADLEQYLQHVVAEFDPRTCTTCSLFRYCRNELRTSPDPAALLVELGVDRATHPALRPLLDGDTHAAPTAEATRAVPASVLANLTATLTGLPVRSGRHRTDPAGRPGTVNVVLAKSDAAALGLHGLALQPVGAGPTTGATAGWRELVFTDPQAPQTRLAVMTALGEAIAGLQEDGLAPIHLTVPDAPTADLLVAMADSLAGVELSRLRWQRDLDAGREPLTFDGAPATLPEPLTEAARLAVSFLLEDDRARALALRRPIVDLRAVLASHLVAGGPAVDSQRLDYLVEWAGATTPLDHRAVSDQVADRRHTPGARLGNAESDDLHAARPRPASASRSGTGDAARYDALVREALAFKQRTVTRALEALAAIPDSALLPAFDALEQDAQQVWQRRYRLRASDLVRFSRTSWFWRNDLVQTLDDDTVCDRQLGALVDPHLAEDLARNAGTREVAPAVVVSLDPPRLEVASRRLGEGTVAVLLQLNGEPVVERAGIALTVQRSNFKLGGMAVAPLVPHPDGGFGWNPPVTPPLAVGDRLVLADGDWFGSVLKSMHEVTVKRPPLDQRSAPKPDCTPESYAEDPDAHQWCCRPHEVAEAEWSDELAARRERGELNPQAWPPLVDEDRFDVGPVAVGVAADAGPAPEHLTLDDLE